MKNYFKTFLQLLGLDENFTTDPDLLREILETDFKLYDLEQIKVLFADKISVPYHLNIFFEDIFLGIQKHHPALCEVIKTLVDEDMIQIKNDVAQKQVLRIVHHTFLLEMITKNMCEDAHFAESIYNHLLAKRKKIYVNQTYFGAIKGIYNLTGTMFSVAKTMSLDRIMRTFIQLRASKHVSAFNVIKLKALVALNIMEATLTDASSHYKNNMYCGFTLAKQPIKNCYLEGENQTLKITLAPGWAPLYETWNFAFIMGNLKNLSVIMPKLIIPSVINTDDSNYLVSRVYALWLSINFPLFLIADKKEPFMIPEAKNIAKIWGKINLRYAESLKESNGAW